MKIQINDGSLVVQRETTDPKAKPSGWTRQLHRWGAEIRLLGMIVAQLNKMGYQVCRASLQKDGHLMGDNWMQYIRTRKNAPKSASQVMIYDADWQVRNSAEDFNNGQPVRFTIANKIGDTTA